MITGIEFVLSIVAIGLGLAMFVLALRRRPGGGTEGAAASKDRVFGTNFYALGIIGLMFFGISFLLDAVT